MDLIRWSDDGNSFIVLDEDKFARTLIPELFKHNKYSSFVRQLNMYGFHKRFRLSDNSMKASETKAKAPSEYYNQYFKRGLHDLLWLIQKPKSPTTGPKGIPNADTKGESHGKREHMSDIGVGGCIKGLTSVRNIDGMTTITRSEFDSLRVEMEELQQQQELTTNILSQIKRWNDESRQQAHGYVGSGDCQAPEISECQSFQHKKQSIAHFSDARLVKDLFSHPTDCATTATHTTYSLPNSSTQPSSQEGNPRPCPRGEAMFSMPLSHSRKRCSFFAPSKVKSHFHKATDPSSEAGRSPFDTQTTNTDADHTKNSTALSNHQTADGAAPPHRSDAMMP